MRETAMRAVDWLDERGKGAWIAAMVIGFIVFWPVGLGILGYMIWSGRMGKGCRSDRRFGFMGRGGIGRFPSSGNMAFDEYREETLRRLEDEQREFGEFLTRLRMAKDKSEFDQFMADRRRGGGSRREDPDNGSVPDTGGPTPSPAY